ncbi:MAG: hypothetical protein HY057_03700, partial [Rhodospirillales bacterium]|nr:hypothetical protein [Rhodospirillales bacterium]
MNQARTGVPRPPPRHPRQGPRPLALHLSTATLTWLSSAAALPFLSGDLRGSKATGAAKAGNEPAAPWPATMGWAPELKDRAAALLRELAAADPEALRIAVGREVRRRLDELETGIRRYRAHPYRRAFDPPPPVWREGTTRLLDYGVVCPQAARGRPLLVVP